MEAQHDANEAWPGLSASYVGIDEAVGEDTAVRVEWREEELRLVGVIQPGRPSKLNTFSGTPNPETTPRFRPIPPEEQPTDPAYGYRVKVAALDALRGGGRTILARTVPVADPG